MATKIMLVFEYADDINDERKIGVFNEILRDMPYYLAEGYFEVVDKGFQDLEHIQYNVYCEEIDDNDTE